MQLRQYLALVRKYAPLIVILTALSVGAAYYYSRTIPPTYRAETTLLVGQRNQVAVTNPYDPYAYTSLAQAFTVVATQPDVLQAAAENTKWPESWETLYFHINASAPSTQLLKIAATDRNPARARAIADEIALQVIDKNPVSRQQKAADSQREFINGEIGQLQDQIARARKGIAELEKQASIENDPTKLQDLNARIDAQQKKIDGWQTSLAGLSALLPKEPDIYLTVLAAAEEPKSPYSPNILQNLLIAGAGGLLLAGALAFLLEYLDDTIKNSDDAQRVLGLSTLGAITRISGRQQQDKLVTWKQPRSPISEAYRVMRTNLRYSGVENPSGALLVTSPQAREGKTTTAANLAVTLAQAGKKVVLVDADLRRPAIDELLGLSNSVGLSDLFLGDARSIESVEQATAIEGLKVITCGPLPPNPAELLYSKRMTEILAELRAQSDMVLLDAPPVMAVADASILGSRCSGAVLVIDPRISRTETCRKAVQSLQQANVRVLGVVLNKVGGRSGSEYYSSHYYYYYSDSKSRGRDKKKPPAQPSTTEAK